MRGNAQNTGAIANAFVPDASAQIRQWPVDGAMFSTPVVGRDADGHEIVYVGGADGALVAFDATAGRELWRFKTDGVIDSAAAIGSDGTVYIPSGDSRIYAVDGESGTEQWRFDLLQRRQFFTPSTIYWWEGNIGIGPDGNLYAGNDDFRLYSLTPAGELRWSVITGLHIWGTPAFWEDQVFVTSFDLHVYAFRMRDGKYLWRRFIGDFIASSPSVDDDGFLYTGALDGSVLSIDGATGRVRWRVQANLPVYASATITPDGGVSIAGSDGVIRMFDRSNGHERWALATRSVIRGSSVAGPDPEHAESFLLYTGDGNGIVSALTPSGQLRWAYDTMQDQPPTRFPGINGSLALGQSSLFVPLARGQMLAVPLDIRTRFPDAPGLYAQLPAPAQPVTPIAAAPVAEPLAAGSLPVVRIQDLSVLTPAIVPTMDQIGLASLWIDIAVVRHDAATGRIVAWGVQRFGMDNQGNPVGVPVPRRLLFAFGGTYRDGTLTLESGRCHFELTAFPVPLDRIVFAMARTHGGWDGLSCVAEVGTGGVRAEMWRQIMRMLWPRPGSLFQVFWRLWREFWVTIRWMRSWFPRQRLSFSGLHDLTVVLQRQMLLLWTFWRRYPWRKWGLLSAEHPFHGEGTFTAVPLVTPLTAGIRLEKITFHPHRRQFIARFACESAPSCVVMPGLLLLDAQTLEPLAVPYTTHTYVSRDGKNGNIKKAVVDIPADIVLDDRSILAIAMLDLTPVGEKQFAIGKLSPWTIWNEFREALWWRRKV